MIYLDSNIFIFAFLNGDEKAKKCKLLLDKAADKETDACTSWLTWDEVVWGIRKHLGMEDAKAAGDKFFEFPYMKVLDVDALIVKMANNIMKRYNLKPRDSIHTATAIRMNAQKFFTYDSDFKKVKELKVVAP